ncbi:MAG TPA: hypothetical protein VGE31_03465 [Candidatus Paceibacterota bacterium]
MDNVAALPVIIPISLSLEHFMPLIFLMVAALYTVLTGVLYYHWNTYANDTKVVSLTYTLYFVITLPLMAVMAGAAFLF